MISFKSVAELVSVAEANNKPLADIAWQWETETSERAPGEIWDDMRERLAVMRQAVDAGLATREKSVSGLVGGEAHLLGTCHSLLGPIAGLAAAYALAVSEVNAGMGKIVACPTAGSCGIVPGTVLAVARHLQCAEAVPVRALFTAAGIGEIIAANATVAGAVGGCQAECGSAAAMAAAAVVEMMGGTPRQSAEALALALKNLLGLACDPVAGLVEVPCVKRNAFAAVHALVAAQMALAGVKSVIPPDEVIDAMYRIGLAMPCSLKETAEGGLATTATGRRIAERLLKNNLSE